MKYMILLASLVSSFAIAEVTCNKANAEFSSGDNRKGVKMFSLLAKSGATCGFEGLGAAFLHGRGADKDLNKSLMAWRKAEEMGSSSASTYIAYLERELNDK